MPNVERHTRSKGGVNVDLNNCVDPEAEACRQKQEQNKRSGADVECNPTPSLDRTQFQNSPTNVDINNDHFLDNVTDTELAGIHMKKPLDGYLLEGTPQWPVTPN